MSQGRRRSPLPPDWPTRRQTRLEADNYTCQRCGTHRPDSNELEVHHATAHDNHHHDHLQTLCKRCHATITGREAAAIRSQRHQRTRPPEAHPGAAP